MRFFFLLFLFFYLISCNNSEDQKILKMDDIIPTSKNYREGVQNQLEEKKVNYYDSLSLFSRNISDTLELQKESIFYPDSVMFLDRFTFQKKEKWFGKSNEITQLVGVWSYKDSLEMKNALFNWLDCFGKTCNTLQLFDEKRMNNQNFLIFTTERKIIYVCSSGNFNLKKVLLNFEKTIKKERIFYVICQNAGSKTEWWRLLDKKWTKNIINI